MLCSEKVANQNAKSLTSFIYKYLFMEVPESLMRKNSVELNSAHRCSQAESQWVQLKQLH